MGLDVACLKPLPIVLAPQRINILHFVSSCHLKWRLICYSLSPGQAMNWQGSRSPKMRCSPTQYFLGLSSLSNIAQTLEIQHPIVCKHCFSISAAFLSFLLVNHCFFCVCDPWRCIPSCISRQKLDSFRMAGMFSPKIHHSNTLTTRRDWSLSL